MDFDVESYVMDNLEWPRASSSDEISAECPFCGKPDHFYINTETKKFICFKCGEAGRGVRGLAKLISCVESITLSQARRVIYRRAITVFRRRKKQPAELSGRVKALRGTLIEDVEDKTDVLLPDEFIPVWHPKQGWRMPLYLKERGIKKETARHWGLGYCQKGRYANRIIFPIQCPNGQSFTSRSVDGTQPKYLNPEDVNHGRLVYGWRTLKDGDLILVEGPMDVLRVWQYGYEIFGIFGNSLHIEQLQLLMTLPPSKPIVVMLDPEEVKASHEICNQLLGRFENVYRARLPDSVDPGESTQHQAYGAYRDAQRHTGNRLSLLKEKLAGFK